MRLRILWPTVAMMAAACSSATPGSKQGSADQDPSAIDRCTGEIVFKKVAGAPTAANPKGILLHGVLDCMNQGARKIDATFDAATTWSPAASCQIDLVFTMNFGGNIAFTCNDGTTAEGPVRTYIPGGNGYVEALTSKGEVIAFTYMMNAAK